MACERAARRRPHACAEGGSLQPVAAFARRPAPDPLLLDSILGRLDREDRRRARRRRAAAVVAAAGAMVLATSRSRAPAGRS